MRTQAFKNLVMTKRAEGEQVVTRWSDSIKRQYQWSVRYVSSVPLSPVHKNLVFKFTYNGVSMCLNDKTVDVGKNSDVGGNSDVEERA